MIQVQKKIEVNYYEEDIIYLDVTSIDMAMSARIFR